MPPQTRAARANPPPGRVYESPRLPAQQVKFQPRRQKVYGRHSLGEVKRKKQETLTQIGFVNLLTDKEIDEEIETYEREGKTRRKTLTPSSKFYTQTLTQLDFDSMAKVKCRDAEVDDEDEDEEEEGEQEQEKEQAQQESSPDKTTKPSPSQAATTPMPPPKPQPENAPSNITHGLRMHDQPSPLGRRIGNTNLNVHTSPIPSSPSKLSLPHQSQISTQAITQDSPLSRVPDSSPFRPRHMTQSTQSTQSPTAQVLSEFTAASTPTPPPPRRVAKTEIADSDADSEADLDNLDNDDEEGEEEEDDDCLAPLPPRTQPQPPIQVPSSPDALLRRRWAVTSSSPPPRPGLAVKETVFGEEVDELGSQWTRSQLLPGSLGMDSLLALPPGWG
ncbi:hypothetical protein GMDG_02913, partial [Pseudogymnoascus destructans 20631-21]